MKAETRIIFVHIPKTAGTTLRRIMEREYGQQRILELYESSVEGAIAACQSLQDGQVKVIAGHKPFGLHVWLSSPAVYMTFLRDPVERVISYCYHIQRSPHHFSYGDARSLTLRGFVESGAPVICNSQTRHLAGLDGRYPQVNSCQSSECMLNRAKSNLQTRFAVVGLVERFDESLILARRAFGWRMPLYVRTNVGPKTRRKEDLSPEIVGIVERNNELDVALHQHARELLGRQVAAQSSTFWAELISLRLLNRLYASLGAVKRLGKSWREQLDAV